MSPGPGRVGRDRWMPMGACPEELGSLDGDNSVPRIKGHWKGTMMSLGAGDIREGQASFPIGADLGEPGTLEGGITVPRSWELRRGTA